MQIYLGNVKGSPGLQGLNRQLLRRQAAKTVKLSQVSPVSANSPAAEVSLRRWLFSRVGKSYGEEEGEPNEVIGDISFSRPAARLSACRPFGLRQDHAAQSAERADSSDARLRALARQAFARCAEGCRYMLQKDLLLPGAPHLKNVTLGLELTSLTQANARRKPMRSEQSRFEIFPRLLSLRAFRRHAPARGTGANAGHRAGSDPARRAFSRALDFQTSSSWKGDMVKLVRSEGRSVLMITHDVEEAVSLSDRVIVLTHRPSSIKAIHEIHLDADRSDMMAVRRFAQFTAMCARSGRS